MVDRAGPFLASRSLTALIVTALVATAFAGMFIIGERASASGDLIIDDETYVIQEVDQLVDGNVVVTNNGELRIIDGSLSVISNFDARYSVTIGAGGKLILDHGVLTTYLDQIRPWAELELKVEDGGEVIATNDSMLMFPGEITLDNGAIMTLRDSTITSLPGTLVDEFVVGSPDGITKDSADDGPSIAVTDSTLKLFDSAVDTLPEYPTIHVSAKNLTLAGDSVLLSVNSYIDVDFERVNVEPDDWWTHNVLVVADSSEAYLYGTHFDPYPGDPAARGSAIDAASTVPDPAYPDAKGGADDTGEDLNALRYVDSLLYVVNGGETMEIDSWDVGGIGAGTALTSATLVVKYSVTSSYDGDDAIEYKRDAAGIYSSTGIIPSAADDPGTEATFEIPTATIGTVGDLEAMDLRFNHNGGAGSVQFESAWVVFSAGGVAYIYRWMNATVGDEYGVPIPDATVSAVFTGSTDLEGQGAFYYTTDGVSSAPEADVLAYMGEDTASFKTTKADGKAVIPYLTDISDGTSNSLFVGTYAFTGSAVVASTPYSSTETYSFEPYPAMELANQSEDLTVELLGATAYSPDNSRWLVVPYLVDMVRVTTLVIEEMSFYHAGDVIVASDGELTVIDSEFLLVQEFPNQRTIYVDGNGVLRFENAYVESELPIDIIVQGHGTLEVIGSTMSGLNIYAREDATILLDSSEIDGEITTSWNSRASIEIYDCELSESPVLSGYTVGSFTNTSVPSIVVEDDALGLIYRWIHVTVLDGNSKPFPAVDVYARFFQNETFWTSAESDAAGVAKLNCLGTILTETGSSFIGVYRVNATYWHQDTIPYESDQEISVGVAPYTEPLGMNATYAVLTISSALPDLEIDSMTGITCDPASPVNGDIATVTAHVENTGVSAAYNVYVNFSDNDDPFASVLCPRILPGETADVSTLWEATWPLDPDEHTLMVVVDEDDSVNEIDDTPAVSYLDVIVQSLPDLELSLARFHGTEPVAAVLDSECTVYADVYNKGTSTATNVPVTFYNASLSLVAPENLIGSTTILTIAPGETVRASISWIPLDTGNQIITVFVDENETISEVDEENNNISFTVTVYPYPDLELDDFVFVSGLSTVAGGDEVVVRATIRNLEAAPVTNPIVSLFIDDAVEPYDTVTVLGTYSEGSNVGVAQFTYVAPILSDDIVMTMVANPDRTFMEQTYDNNEVNATLTVTDARPDLQVTNSSIYVTYGGNNITGQSFGRTVSIVVEVENLGPRPVVDVPVTVGIDEYVLDDEIILAEVAAGGMTPVSVEWRINLTIPDGYEIWVSVDPEDLIDEPDDANNDASFMFTVEPLDLSVAVTLESLEYEAGDTFHVSVSVYYADETGPDDELIPVVALPSIEMALYDEGGSRIDATVKTVSPTTEGGLAGQMMEIPETLPSGQYTVGVEIQGVRYNSAQITITGAGEDGGIPLLIWILVIAIIVAVVVGFTLYTYIYGLGKLVECGECGSFIPAASKRCPKCGVEFEAGTMKCSECGQWVPSTATECPNCGVKFVGEPEGEELDYLDRMRTEYDAMVSEYRELAKSELGKKFSDKRFEVWWKAQPTYVSFEDWLAKEEEKRKEGPVPCSVCGTLNPREATVCHKCGTIFAPAEEPALPPEQPVEAPEQPSQAPPRRPPPTGGAGPGTAAAPKTVVRRPIDRKVVPKKIIRAPVDKDEQG